MLFLDSSVVMVSPLCTPLTYEALIVETVGIEHSYVTVANDRRDEDPSDPKAAKRAAKLRAAEEHRYSRPSIPAFCSPCSPTTTYQCVSVCPSLCLCPCLSLSLCARVQVTTTT